MIKVIDNFLNDLHFAQIHNTILDNFNFPWFLGKIVDQVKDTPYQLAHHFHYQGKINSDFYPLVEPILQKLKIKELMRIKANLIMKTENTIKHGYHIDDRFKKTPYTTAIYYLNSNNGYTEFKNGKKVNSIKNRIVIFDGLIEHRGTSCTDQPYRSVINFNYLKK